MKLKTKEIIYSYYNEEISSQKTYTIDALIERIEICELI